MAAEPPLHEAKRAGLGPSRALMLIAGAALLAVVVLSVLLAKRQAPTQQSLNSTQFALSSAVQAAEQVYNSNKSTFPSGEPLIEQLQRQDSLLQFAFGSESVSGSPPSSTTLTTPISVAVSADGQVVMFAAQATNGTCWYATDNQETRETSGGLYGASTTRGTTYAAAPGQQSCSAGNALPVNVAAWDTTWPTT